MGFCQTYCQLLFREVPFFLRALPQIGKERRCIICGWRFSRFLSTGIDVRPDVRCPRCNSHERHRAVWFYLNGNTSLFNSKKKKLLHVAPEFCFARKFRKLRSIEYTSVDSGYGLAQVNQDVTRLRFSDDSFDCFIIIHVLEHIQDEKSALGELHRVLKQGGWGIIQVPMDLSLEKTKEDSSADTPEKRLAAFGQDDHVRLYAKDFKIRLEHAGFKVEYINMWNKLAEEDRELYRISENEPFYFVKKN